MSENVSLGRTGPKVFPIGMGLMGFGALSKKLADKDVEELERLVPPDSIAGTRYAPEQMKMLDSER